KIGQEASNAAKKYGMGVMLFGASNGMFMYSAPVKNFMLDHAWARQVGALVAANYGPGASAAWAAYLTDISGGSFNDVLKSIALSYVSSVLTQQVSGMKYDSLSDVIKKVTVSGVVGGTQSVMYGGKFSAGFKKSAIVTGLEIAALKMREIMVSQSKIDDLNATGKSVGFRSDGFKLAGGRFNIANLESWLPCDPNTGSPLGGWQGGEGRFFGISYQSGSVLDYVVEAFAGPHDYLNSGYWYDSFGDIKQMSNTARYFGEALNAVNVLVATPFVAASVVAPHSEILYNPLYK
ncbi:MAG: hypothetical protein HY080_14640, partial [Gammaproteobacteria bacterium]|nr:hypothetical protein [Gammaproteobacteria bacterium]